MKYLIIFLIQLAIASSVNAETVQWSKGFTAGCDNATERTDGTPLDVSEIDRVEYYIDPTDQNPSPAYTIPMAGGCQDLFVDTRQFPVGDYFRYAKTIDTDDRESDLSPGTAFTIQKPRPNPPGNLR